MNLLRKNLKSDKGQLATLLNLIIALCVIVVVGMFAFELTSYLLARDELKTNVEVAALSCQTTLASSGDPTNADNQTAAESAALQLFRTNSILGIPMSSATLVQGQGALDPGPGQAQISFQMLDPLTRLPVNANGAGVSSGVTSPVTAGTLIEAVGAYCFKPPFGQFIGLANAQFTFQVSALAGIPKIDMMVLLDISGGMDDDTSVSYYQRFEGPNGTNWMIPNSPNGYNGEGIGQIANIACPVPGETPEQLINALQPCQYENLANSTCLKYSEDPQSTGSNGLASSYGQGVAPYCGVSTSSSSSSSSMLPLPSNTKHIAGVHRTNKHAKQLKIARAKTNKKTNRLIGLHKNNEKQNIARRISDPSLIDICEKISGKRATNNLLKKIVSSQLDDKFSQISFKPSFDAFPSGTLNNTTTGSTTSGVIFANDPALNPPPSVVGTYKASDGMTYAQYSNAPGSGQNTNSAAPMPALPAPSCNGTVSTVTTYGAAAPSVFSGVIVNGAIDAKDANNAQITLNCLATAVEASLGDLESKQNAINAGIDVNALGVVPQAGWYAFYYAASRPFLQPMMAIFNGLTGFINEMSITADINYGFVAFNDNIGANSTSLSAPINNASSLYNYSMPNPSGAASVSYTYPLPNIVLNPGSSNQGNVINALPTLSVWGGRNVTQALTEAFSQLQNNGRPGANPVILLITSGAPSGSDSAAAAISQATTIGQSGIPIYVICTSLNSTYDSANDAAYTHVGGSSGGVAGASGHGAMYFRTDFVDPTTTGNQLVTIYGNIARRLVSIVPGS